LWERPGANGALFRTAVTTVAPDPHLRLETMVLDTPQVWVRRTTGQMHVTRSDTGDAWLAPPAANCFCGDSRCLAIADLLVATPSGDQPSVPSRDLSPVNHVPADEKLPNRSPSTRHTQWRSNQWRSIRDNHRRYGTYRYGAAGWASGCGKHRRRTARGTDYSLFFFRRKR
jgi:hypothetical protein